MSQPFLKSNGGQTIQQLIAMRDSHRVDSLVLAVEQALASKSEAELSEPERVILAVEAMEREVNNGCYEQFLGNSREFTVFLVRACAGADRLSEGRGDFGGRYRMAKRFTQWNLMCGSEA
jgi:hypothetical protein